jgi:hypothetical protein
MHQHTIPFVPASILPNSSGEPPFESMPWRADAFAACKRAARPPCAFYAIKRRAARVLLGVPQRCDEASRAPAFAKNAAQTNGPLQSAIRKSGLPVFLQNRATSRESGAATDLWCGHRM